MVTYKMHKKLKLTHKVLTLLHWHHAVDSAS